MNFPRWLLPTIALLAAPLAYADIIFIDLNLSSQEVAAARAAAKQRGENLIVIPDVSPEFRTERAKLILHMKPLLKAMETESNAINKKLDVLEAKSNKNKNATKEEKEKINRAISELNRQQDVIDNEWSKIIKPYNVFMESHRDIIKVDIVQALERELLKYKNTGKTISSLVISGHHVGSFFGTAGKGGLSREAIMTTLDKYPEIADQISSLYLWGCYTNTIDETKAWKTALPKLSLIAGFDHSAPSEDKEIDEAFLKGILVKEKNATSKMDEKKLASLFNSIPNIKMSSATLTCGDYYATSHGVTKISKIGCNPQDVKSLQAGAEVFLQYLTAQQYTDVPSNTQRSDLRTFYSRLRQMSHCPELKALSAETGRILRLIFSKNVIKNFNDFFRNDINQLNASLKDAQPPGGSFPDLSGPNLDRAELLEKIGAFSAYWAQPSMATAPAFASANKLALAAQAILKNMNCIGSFWIEYPEDQQRLTNDLDPACLARGGEN